MIAPATPAATRAARAWEMTSWKARFRGAKAKQDRAALDDLDDELLAMGGAA